MAQPSTPHNDRLESLTPLQRAFLKNKELERRLERVLQREKEPVAVIGFACRFPGGADTPEAFWELLRNGVDAIREVPHGKLTPGWAGTVDGMDLFDAEFFGISPTECFHLDPQHRVLLMVAYEALERACILPEKIVGSSTSVFIGVSGYDYALRMVRDLAADSISPYHGSGNSASGAAGRLSYFFGLQGPCMSIDTACSSSLIAMHEACLSLRAGECDLSLCGGVNFLAAAEPQISLTKAGMLAKDGRCKTFDARADGYVRSEGCGILVLKRLSDAERDGDPILALVRSSAIGQDGRSGGLTVPNRAAQENLIRTALAKAGVTPDALDYVEAHGTGTPLGDPIEVDALAAVLAKGGFSRPELWIGSVKANMGHLEAAAGVAGIAKVILALKNEAIPPHLHQHNPNPRIAWDRIPIRVNTTLREWKRRDRPRMAGVSSFGFTGSLGHMVLQEAPGHADGDPRPVPGDRCVKFSARSDKALRELARKYAVFLKTAQVSLRDLAYTANVCRSSFEHRLVITASTCQEVTQGLNDFLNGVPNRRVRSGTADPAMQNRNKQSVPDETDNEARCAAIAGMFVQGMPLDWEAVEAGSGGRKVELPTYPFQLKRYWFSEDAAAPSRETYFHENAYTVVWQVLPEPITAPFDAGHGVWIILADDGGVWERFQSQLTSHGAPYRVVSVTRRDDFIRFFAELRSSGVKRVAGAVNFLSLNVPDKAGSGEAEREVEWLLAASLNFVQAASQFPELLPNRLALVTSNAAPVHANRAVHPERAALWGLGKVIQLEMPEMSTVMIDLDGDEPIRSSRLVSSLLAGGFPHDQFAIRDDTIWIPRLSRIPQQPSARRISVSKDPSAWYLVAGGLGTLGIGAAEWLTNRGAKRLVLTSRSRKSVEDRAERLKALEQRGIEVTVVEADAADEQAMRRLLDGRKAAGGKLRGIVLTAGINRPEALADISADGLREVCRPKVAAARLLHDCSAAEDLDFFICFSSIASVWGSALLGSYSAANAYLDALAHLRRSQGLKCTSINWGAWRGSRMVLAANDPAQNLERRGIRLLDPERTFEALDALVGTGLPQVVFASIDWKTLLPVMELRRTSAFWDLIRAEAEQPGASEPSLSGAPAIIDNEFKSLPAAARKKHLRARVTGILAEVLGYGQPGDVSPVRPFQEQGMDSILVVQFAEKLSSLLGREIRASMIFNYPTLEDLVEKLFQELPAQEPVSVEADSHDEAAGELFENLSDEELLDFVTEELRRFQ